MSRILMCMYVYLVYIFFLFVIDVQISKGNNTCIVV
jgi:hypothetical protein